MLERKFIHFLKRVKNLRRTYFHHNGNSMLDIKIVGIPMTSSSGGVFLVFDAKFISFFTASTCLINASILLKGPLISIFNISSAVFKIWTLESISSPSESLTALTSYQFFKIQNNAMINEVRYLSDIHTRLWVIIFNDPASHS